MGETLIIPGNFAVAHAAKDARAKVVAAYPITPQTTIVEEIAKFIEYGKMDARMIRVESEHSAMAACIGAQAMGVRTFTATASHGLALMHEMVWYAANARLPIVMAIANRTMGPPWNIWADWGDAMAERDVGWIQFWGANPQEVYDTILLAYKVAENHKVCLPAMVSLEAFILTHTSMPVEVDPEKAAEYVGEYEPFWKLDPEDPIIMGNLFTPDDTFKMRYDMWKSMERAKKVIKEANKEFVEIFGRDHGDLIEKYKMDDAETAIISMGTVAEEATVAVDMLREEGMKVGSIRIRAFRPFPREDLLEALEGVSKVIVLERSVSMGAFGQIYQDLAATMMAEEKGIELLDVFVGIGGSDVTYRDMAKIVKLAEEGKIDRIPTWHKMEVK